MSSDERPLDRALDDQLDLPAAVRDAGGDDELQGLLAMAAAVEEDWRAVEPAPGAADRVWTGALARHGERRRRLWRRLPSLPASLGWRGRIAGIGAVAAAAYAIVVVIGSFGGGPNAGDVAQRALAAFDGHGRVVHERLDGHLRLQIAVVPLDVPYHADAWTLLGGKDRGDRAHVVIRDAAGHVLAEVAAAPRSLSAYSASDDTIRSEPAATAARLFGPGRDPLGAFSADDVTSVRAGHVGSTPSYALHFDLGATNGLRNASLDYVVDQRDYHPLNITFHFTVDVRGLPVTGSFDASVAHFAVLPAGPRSLALLRLQPHPGARHVAGGLLSLLPGG